MTYSLSTSRLNLEFLASDAHLRLSCFALAHSSWFSATSPLFAVEINGQRFDAANLSFLDFTFDTQIGGVKHGVAFFSGEGFRIDYHVKAYADTALIESWQVLHSTSESPFHVTHMDSISLDLPTADYELLRFSSDWGQEFEPIRTLLSRRSHARNPHRTFLQRPASLVRPFSRRWSVLSGSIGWSGNWSFPLRATSAKWRLQLERRPPSTGLQQNPSPRRYDRKPTHEIWR